MRSILELRSSHTSKVFSQVPSIVKLQISNRDAVFANDSHMATSFIILEPTKPSPASLIAWMCVANSSWRHPLPAAKTHCSSRLRSTTNSKHCFYVLARLRVRWGLEFIWGRDMGGRCRSDRIERGQQDSCRSPFKCTLSKDRRRRNLWYIYFEGKPTEGKHTHAEEEELHDTKTVGLHIKTCIVYVFPPARSSRFRFDSCINDHLLVSATVMQ